jgi:hypothetical protein
MFIKLATMKSDLKSRLNIKDHARKTSELKERLERNSPQKIKKLRTFFRRRHIDFGHSLMPTSLHSEFRDHSVENAEDHL